MACCRSFCGNKKIYLGIAFLAVLSLLLVNLFVMKKESTLLFVNGFFRHGEKSLLNAYTYKNDPHINYSYFPEEVGHVTMNGKKRMYEVGVQLRERYNNLLGEIYSKYLITARTSSLPRAEESLQVLLASLFKPTKEYEVEDGLLWQPVTYDVIPPEEDDMLAMFKKCTEFFEIADQAFLESTRYNKSHEMYKDVLQYISDMAGENYNTVRDVFDLYNILKYQKDNGLVLPDWTKKIYPQPIKSLSTDFLEGIFENEVMVKYSAGRLLEIFEDSFRKKIAGKLHEEHKMNIFCGHEFGIYGILRGLNIDVVKAPYSAYVLVELHYINGVYGVKIFYQDHTTEEPVLKIIKGCDGFCPLHDFIQLTRKYYPNPNVCMEPVNKNTIET